MNIALLFSSRLKEIALQWGNYRLISDEFDNQLSYV